jgi:membrane associated rhomboid family serine protease
MLACIVVNLYQVIQPAWMQRAIMETYALVPARFALMATHGLDVEALPTLLTSMFMHAGWQHGGWLHIVGNLWYLHIFGDSVEEQLGSTRYAVLYLLAGIAAGIVQIAVDPFSTVPMVGASGAIAGVLAAHIVLQPRSRVVTLVPLLFVFVVELPSFVLIAVWFGLQFVSGVESLGMHVHGGTAYWAHIGGFAAGLVLVTMLKRGRTRFRRDDEPAHWRSERDWRY